MTSEAGAVMATKTASNLAKESWILYTVGLFVFGARIFCRWRLPNRDSKGLHKDDFVMLAVMVCYTLNIVMLNQIASGGGSNLYYPTQLKDFSRSEIKDRIKGSKLVMVSEQAMILTIWGVKACMIIFYWRLTYRRTARRYVCLLAFYVILGFAACELAIFIQCRPFRGYWAVPPPKPNCTTYYAYAVVNAIFNISSDMIMMSIVLPIIFKSKLALKQKIACCGVFLLGVFVVIAAILTKVFNLTDEYSTVYMFWYVRESSVAVYVGNLPMVWPILRRIFPWCLGRRRRGTAYSEDVELSGGGSGGDSGRNKKCKREQDATLWEDNNSSAEVLPSQCRRAAGGGIRQDVTFEVASELCPDWRGDRDARAGVFDERALEDLSYKVAVKTRQSN